MENSRIRYTAKFKSELGFHDKKIEPITSCKEKRIQDEIKNDEVFKKNSIISDSNSAQYKSEFHEIKTVYNNEEDCFEVPNKNKTQVDFIITKDSNNYPTNSNDLNSSLFQLITPIIPIMIECIPEIFAIIRNKTENINTNNQNLSEILKLIQLIVLDKKAFQKPEGENECKKAVWNKIIEMNKEIFRKVDLTIAFQKRFKSDQIMNSLNGLCEEGLIKELPYKNLKKPGRKPSPQYEVVKKKEN